MPIQNIKIHILLASTFLLLSIFIFEITDIDIWLQNFLFNFETKTWLLNQNKPLYDFYNLIFYTGLKKSLIFFAVFVLFILLIFRKTNFVKEYKKGLITIVLSAILVPFTVITLKNISNVPCPKNIAYYGGTYPNLKAFDSYPKDFVQDSKIRCWPAGHASGGFALLALFFFFKSSKNRYLALGFALFIGWSMGIYKMLLGDHFLSHTIISMLIAWLINLLITYTLNFLYKDSNETF